MNSLIWPGCWIENFQLRNKSLCAVLVLFPTHLHTSKTICPSIPPLGRATQKGSCFHRKVHSIPHSVGNFPKDASRSLSFPITLAQQHPRAHTRYMRAGMLICFIYLSAEQTTCCVSLVSGVMMMKGTCCSQQKPLSTLCYWHRACIIHKSSGNSVTSRRLSTFVTWAEGKCRRGWVDPCPHGTSCEEKMRQ